MKIALVALLVVVLVAAAAGGGFYIGNNYGVTQAQNIRNEFFQSRFANQGGGAGNFAPGAQRGQGQNQSQGQNQAQAQGQGQGGRNAAAGTVKSVQGDTIVVTQRDGSTLTVKLDSNTQIVKTVAGSPTDLQPGEIITVQSNQTGNTITAQTIQLRGAGQ